MTVRLLQALTVKTKNEEDQDALFGIEEWGFRQWAALDRTLE
jgi:hypothetical protein